MDLDRRGETILRLVTDEGLRSLKFEAGMVVIVPQDMWHQFVSSDGVSVMTSTPLPTDHVRADVDDSRTVGEELHS